MFYRTLLPFILAICQYSMSLECAYINVSFSATNIAVNGSFEITLIGVFPNEAAVIPSLACGYIDAGRIVGFAKYNFFVKKFQLWLPLPVKFAGRIKIRSDKTAAIVPVRISDENHEFGCTFDYHDSSGTKYTLRSHRTTIENVYALPVISSNFVQGSLTVVEGESKDVICNVTSRPASKITWPNDPGVIGTASQSILPDPVDSNYSITIGKFRINPVDAMNGKKIKCTGIPVFGSAVSKTSTLNVLYKPKGTVFTVTPSELTLSAEVKMTCSATGIPSVRSYKFYRNGLLIGNTTDGKLSFNVHPSNCSRYNGEYKCVPESTIGDGETKTETRKFNWNLTLKPSSAINEGQDAVLNCSNTICPTSNISWKLNGAILPNSGNELKIISATKDNAGTYSCHPSHYNKMKLAEIALNVRYKPDTVIFTSDTLKPVNQHKVTLTCSSNGFPTPQYRIFKVSGTSSTLISDGASGNYSMASINYADYIGYNATFMCISYNTLGNSSAKYIQLDIRVKPLLVTPSHLKVKKGANVAFSCKILAANPATNVTWTDPLNQAIQHSNGVVKINNIASNQLGIYSCHANNSVGKTTKTVTLSFDLSGGVGTILSSKVATIGSVIVGLAIVMMISDI